MELRVKVRESLHARPAASFVQAVLDSGEPVGIARPGGAPADAASILSVLALDIDADEEVVLTAASPALLDRLAALLDHA